MHEQVQPRRALQGGKVRRRPQSKQGPLHSARGALGSGRRKELQIKSATREKDVKKVEKEAPEKEVHIILNPVNQKPVPPELSPYGETLEEAELKATRMIKQINDMKNDKHKIKPVLEQKLIWEVAEAAKEAHVCEFAKQLHDKYVTRVKHEVELDEEETPGNSVKLLRQETKRANRIVKRRARREARREIRMNGMKIEAKVRQMLSQKDGQQKAQTFLKELQNKHCAPAEYAIKEAEVPKIKDVDSWSNCFKQKSICKISDDVRTNCAKTCKEHAAVDKHRPRLILTT